MLLPLVWIASLVVFQTPTATITGRVTDAKTGQPIQGVLVEALEYAYDESGARSVRVFRNEFSDVDGRYELHVRAATDYYVASAIRDTPQQQYTPTFFPGTPMRSRATTIRLTAGESRIVDFALRPAERFTVYGRVVDALNVRQPHISRIWSSAGSGPRYVNKDDTFVIRNVLPGTHNLSGSRLDDEPNRAEARLEFEVFDKDVEVKLVFAEGHNIAGRVSGDNVKDANIALMNVDEKAGSGGALWRQPDGTFQLFGVPSGEYRLSVRDLPFGYYVSSARMGQVNLLTDTVRIRGVVREKIDVVLSPNSGSISGTVIDSEGASTVSIVTLVPSRQRVFRPDLFKWVNTDENGRFLIDGVAPGDYELFAWEYFQLNSYFDPAFAGRFQGRGQSVRLEPNGSAAVELRRTSPQ